MWLTGDIKNEKGADGRDARGWKARKRIFRKDRKRGRRVNECPSTRCIRVRAPSRHTSVSCDRKSQSHIDTNNTNHSAGRPSQAGLRKGAPAFHPSQAKRVALRTSRYAVTTGDGDVERRVKVEELLTDSLPNTFGSPHEFFRSAGNSYFPAVHPLSVSISFLSLFVA